MFHDAQVYLSGYVANEPKVRKVSGDVSSLKLRVAYTVRRRDRETGEWSDGPTTFVNVQCWRTLADNVFMSVHKGEPVLVMGRLQMRRFEGAEGTPRIVVEIEASSVGHDLTRGVAQFSRTRWPSPAAAEATAQPGTAEPGPAEPGPEEPGGEEPGEGGELPAGMAPGERPATAIGAGVPPGREIVAETAVTELARELSERHGAAALADPGFAGADEEAVAAGVGVPA